MAVVTINTRIKNKHATEDVWNSSDFIPLQGEIIVYDRDDEVPYQRMKIGDGQTLLSELPFLDETMVIYSENVIHLSSNSPLSDILNTYILNIDYNELSFDTTEIVVESTVNNTSVLDHDKLEQMILD